MVLSFNIFMFKVRVCDTCFDLYGPKDEAASGAPRGQPQPQKKKQEGDLPAEYLASPLSKQV